MMEIKVVFPHPDGPTSMSSSPRRTSRSMPRSAITFVSPVPYVFVTPRQLTANCSLDPVVSVAYSIICSSALFTRGHVFRELRLRTAAEHELLFLATVSAASKSATFKNGEDLCLRSVHKAFVALKWIHQRTKSGSTG